MSYKISLSFCLLLSILLFEKVWSQSYKATYTIKLTPDSTNLESTRKEDMYLFIMNSKESFCATKNFLKSDSIAVMLDKGTATLGDVIANHANVSFSRFKQFVHKDYVRNSCDIFESVEINYFHYPADPGKLHWEMTEDTAQLNGYQCSKAVTQYAGRFYEAWFTSEIPISDGPYLFRGLPGLIVKIHDSRQHYSFSLEKFEEYTEPITTEPYFASKAIKTLRHKVFSVRERFRTDFMSFIPPGTTIQGVDMEAVKKRVKANNNPMELK